MRVSMIVFSPSGHTLKASQLFKKEFESNNIKVQLIDITKNENYLNSNDVKQYLEEELAEHDIILIGGPVYAGHVEKNILKIVNNLPEAGGKMGYLAVPFVTYGGVHSSIALEEMGRYLKRKRRKSILGVKIAAEHTLTKTFSNVINEQKPGKLEEKIIAEAVEKIIKIREKDYKKIKDVSKSFKYSSLPERVVLYFLSQDFFHKKFKNVSINTYKCMKCKKCISVCPVNMFDYSNGEVYIVRDKAKCILCAECYHACPVGAIEYPYIEKARQRLKDGYAELEKRQSAIYPKKI
ncbi:MAG: 4Fe-4S dicluster domain-containing protein [Firmicutes bacterium]|nr:4Fe-4S dicluster domain-containing protein [Bacillota bacterium]